MFDREYVDRTDRRRHPACRRRMQEKLVRSTDDMRGEGSGFLVKIVELPEHAFLRKASFDLPGVRLDVSCHRDDRAETAAELVAAVLQ